MGSILRYCVCALLLPVFGIAVAACSGADPEQVATEVAQQWTESSIDEVSRLLGEVVTGGTPVLERITESVIGMHIRERVQWSLSTPSKVAEDRYEVVASTRVPIDINLVALEWSSVVSVDLELSIDTD